MNRIDKEQFELFKNYPDVLTVQQVREALGIGRVGVYKLLESGCIHSFMIGNAYKIPKTSLIEFIQQRCGENKGGK